MEQKKLLAASALGAAALILSSSAAFAHENNGEKRYLTARADTDVAVSVGASAEGDRRKEDKEDKDKEKRGWGARANAEANASTTREREKEERRGAGRGVFMNASSTANASTTIYTHGDRIKNIVERLKEIAREDRKHGRDIDDIAERVASTSVQASTTIEQMRKESRLKALLLGFDLKNIGELRSSIAVTQAQIERLRRIASSTTDAQLKAAVEAQITALQASASTTAAFIVTHEETFSLLGWFKKFFSRE